MTTLYWNYNPENYKKEDEPYVLPPEGIYQVRITGVEYMKAASGKDMYSISLRLVTHKTTIKYFLVLNRENVEFTDQNIGRIFDSFDMNKLSDIVKFDTDNWLDRWGAVEIVHKTRKDKEGNDRVDARVKRFLTYEEQEKLGFILDTVEEDLGMPF